MADIIFHHYQSSPFSEKVRAIFGFKKLHWKSVIIPAILPKPDLTALTGGYRRTPVLQIGADIYCDTALIADVLERIAPAPALYPAQYAGLAKTLAQWADTTLFWTMIPHVFQPAGVQYMFARLTPEQIKEFSADRAVMRANAPRIPQADATAQLAEYLSRLEHMLADGKPYLLGQQVSIADFSVYHCIWYIRRTPVVADILERAPKLLAWAERMAAFGHHQFEAMDSGEALAIAHRSSPAAVEAAPFIDTHGAALGDRVTLQPTDYALDPVAGELVMASATEFAIRRHDERAGTVLVHFPRLGFQLKKI